MSKLTYDELSALTVAATKNIASISKSVADNTSAINALQTRLAVSESELNNIKQSQRDDLNFRRGRESVNIPTDTNNKDMMNILMFKSMMN